MKRIFGDKCRGTFVSFKGLEDVGHVKCLAVALLMSNHSFGFIENKQNYILKLN